MKWQGSYRTTVVWWALAASIVAACAGSSKAEIVISEPINLGPVINHSGGVQACDFSYDGLELYLAFRNRTGGFGGGDIWVSTRETLDSPWQEPVNLGSNVNSGGSELEPSISSDGLELYFSCWSDYILRVCTRPSKDAPWSKPEKIGPPVGSTQPAMEIGSDDAWRPDISSDGLSLYFCSTRADSYGGTDIWMARRATTSDPWTAPVNLGPNVNTGADDVFPNISTDGLTLIFNRGFSAIYASTRKSIEDDWGPAVQLGIRVPSPGNFHSPALSPDGTTLYFEAVAAWGGYGGNDFWQVTFTPVVDFNADGIVDAMDMSIMTADWHTHRPLCDVGPLPIGDNYVDVEDLLVLADYLEPGDPMLIAHWAFDETEGIVAEDSAGACHGTVLGTALWQPEAGQVDGALELDGNTFVVADHVLSPSDGPYTVQAWVQGDVPGRVILSQVDGANWLCTDLTSGCLMTELKGAGRDSRALCSHAIVADGNWHRVALVCDGEARCLYVDEVLAAEDTQAGGFQDCSGSLNIGCDKNMTPGTFFTGLIDDVRIYNRAVQP
ncbi:LamG-like jellyroll fold domain-containing protein [Anaerobaca lacustris]|uniref:LamG domain-containing protein n=1 Tax=Anaerobaca lacustris TaxID=3044600 RepID=A0AAW6U0N7_9BACT|nr:LamG domain-containing protein [Sedimentisphaerales bacterium M17dextr]